MGEKCFLECSILICIWNDFASTPQRHVVALFLTNIVIYTNIIHIALQSLFTCCSDNLFCSFKLPVLLKRHFLSVFMRKNNSVSKSSKITMITMLKVFSKSHY